jgi:UDP-glucose 4-epimerase
MRVLVTGVAGFIGSNLAAELLRRGHEVSGLDNLSQGTLLNLAGVEEHPSFSFHECDMRDADAVIECAEGCQAIVHLAAYKIPRYGDAHETLTINALGAQNVGRAAEATRAKIVAASTSDVYGKSTRVPFKEEEDSVIGSPQVKRWAYAVSKMFEEQLLLACHERLGLNVVLLRFFGCYGPHQNLSWWGGPQSVFIDKAIDDEPIPLHGDGTQTRTLSYVSDHVAGIVAAIERGEADNLVINLGSDREISIADLARLIWRLVRGEDAEPKLEFIPYETFGRYEDVMRRVPDLTRARELLGFEPRVDLETGLAQTIRWQIERRRDIGRPAALTAS